MRKIILFLLLSAFYILDCNCQNINFYQDKVYGDILLYNKSRGAGGRVLVPSVNNSVTVNFGNDFSGGVRIGGWGELSDALASFSINSPIPIVFYKKIKSGTIYSTGNIGIGIENPIERLEVNGTIRSKEVKIEATGWPDFVFAKDYELPSLFAVEKHINEKGTLPDIPSEQEVKENGIAVGDMQAKLLQKIEELTLYVIELKKENEEQNKLIQQLQNAK